MSDLSRAEQRLHMAPIEWHCEYPEFNDLMCQSGMGNPQPDKTRQPRKHTQCRWVLLVDVEGEER